MSRRLRARTAAVLAAATTLALLTAGCGGDDAQTLAITVSGPQDFEVPATADPGLAEITITNSGDEAADAQLIRAEGEHTAQEVIQGLAAAMRGKAVPDWFFAAGGSPPVPAGSERTVTQVLQPGTYYVFDTEGLEGPPDPDKVPSFTVDGEPSEDELPGADARVAGFEYGFEAAGLQAGENEILFENTGDEPHHLIAAPIARGKTFDDVERFLETEEGEPPIDEENEVSTAVVEGGQGQIVTLDLKAGKYALLCFIADRDGGPPHAFQGMVVEAKVPGGTG